MQNSNLTKTQEKRLNELRSYLRNERLKLDKNNATFEEVITNALAYLVLIKDNDGIKLAPRVPIIEWIKMPIHFQEEVRRYFIEADIRCTNGSYGSFPMFIDSEPGPIQEWFYENGVSLGDEEVLLHFNW